MDKRKSSETPSRDWMSADKNQWNTVEWFGCIFFYLINLGKVKFKILYHPKYSRRNVIVGYFIQLFAVLGGIALLMYLF